MQQHDLAGEAARFAEIVGRQHHLDAARNHGPDHIFNCFGGGGIEACGRLVEEQNLRIAGERAGERQPLLLAAGQPPGGTAGKSGETHELEQFIDARDLAEWTIRMAEQRAFGTFNATGPDFQLSMAAMLHGIRASGTAAARFVWAPDDFLEKNKVSPWSDMPVWIPRHGDPAFATRNVGRAQAAGLTFRPLATTAADTLAWFRTLPAERQAKLGAGLTAERESELLALLKKDSSKA